MLLKLVAALPDCEVSGDSLGTSLDVSSQSLGANADMLRYHLRRGFCLFHLRVPVGGFVGGAKLVFANAAPLSTLLKPEEAFRRFKWITVTDGRCRLLGPRDAGSWQGALTVLSLLCW